MIREHFRIPATVVLVCCLLGGVQCVEGAVQYIVTPLGVPNSQVYQINQTGQVVGYVTAADGSEQGFVWTAGQMAMLPTLVGNSRARALNDHSQIVGGASAASGSADPRAVLWQSGAIQDLTTLGGPKLTVSYGINNAGQILVGTGTSGYLWEDGVLRSLGFEGGNAINESGQVAGAQNTGQSDANGSIFHGVFWEDGTIHDLGTLGGKRSVAYDLNDAGLVVGAANRAESLLGGADTACYWDAIGIHRIPIGGEVSLAFGVNNLAQIVGQYSAGPNGHAFLYSDGIATDLNDLIDPSSGWSLLVAKDINDQGQIIGQGWFEGQGRPYLLTPVPLPATLALILPGLMWIARRI